MLISLHLKPKVKPEDTHQIGLNASKYYVINNGVYKWPLYDTVVVKQSKLQDLSDIWNNQAANLMYFVQLHY